MHSHSVGAVHQFGTLTVALSAEIQKNSMRVVSAQESTGLTECTRCCRSEVPDPARVPAAGICSPSVRC